MYDKAHGFYPVDVARLGLRESVSNLASQGLTLEEITAEFNSAIASEFGSPSPQPPNVLGPQPGNNPNLIRSQILSTYTILGVIK